jgi:hypothetical protein
MAVVIARLHVAGYHGFRVHRSKVSLLSPSSCEARAAAPWRQRAEEARRMADLIDVPSKEAMLRIAEEYENLAERAEQRAKRSA